RGERKRAEHARADALRDRADRAALAGAIAALEHDDRAQPLVFDPFLELAELGLQAAQLPFVFLALHPGRALHGFNLGHLPHLACGPAILVRSDAPRP